MFPISTLLTDFRFQGYIFDILGAWAGIVFVGAAECEISFVIFSEMNDVGGYSGDDPTCVGIVQSIEAHPWHPPRVIRHGNHHSFSLCYPEHSEYPPRYVNRAFILYTQHNRISAVFPIT